MAPKPNTRLDPLCACPAAYYCRSSGVGNSVCEKCGETSENVLNTIFVLCLVLVALILLFVVVFKLDKQLEVS